MHGPVLVMAVDAVAWLAGAPDALVVLACCLAACVGAFPVARWLGLVDWMTPRRMAKLAELNKLADEVSSLADGRAGVESKAGGALQVLVHSAAAVLARGLPPADTRYEAQAMTDGWLEQRGASRAVLLGICRFGPAAALGASLAMLVLMAEYWANPAAISSVAASGIGVLMVLALLCTTLLSAAADRLELAEATDQVAAAVVIEAVRRIAAGEQSASVRLQLEALLRPRSELPATAELRKAA